MLTDIFGKNGIMILSGISSGKNVDDIIGSLSPNIRKKSDKIREVLDYKMSLSAAIRIQTCLSLIKNIGEQINILEAEIFRYAYENHGRQLLLS